MTEESMRGWSAIRKAIETRDSAQIQRLIAENSDPAGPGPDPCLIYRGWATPAGERKVSLGSRQLYCGRAIVWGVNGCPGHYRDMPDVVRTCGNRLCSADYHLVLVTQCAGLMRERLADVLAARIATLASALAEIAPDSRLPQDTYWRLPQDDRMTFGRFFTPAGEADRPRVARRDAAMELVETIRSRSTPSGPVNDQCWLWNGPLDKGGYPMLSRVQIHREIIEVRQSSTFARGWVAHHSCGQRACTKDEHLHETTKAANTVEGSVRKAFVRRVQELERDLHTIQPEHPFLHDAWWEDSWIPSTPASGGIWARRNLDPVPDSRLARVRKDVNTMFTQAHKMVLNGSSVADSCDAVGIKRHEYERRHSAAAH